MARKRAYSVTIHKQKFVYDEIAKILEKGIIRPSTSWAAQIVLVPKEGFSMNDEFYSARLHWQVLLSLYRLYCSLFYKSM